MKLPCAADSAIAAHLYNVLKKHLTKRLYNILRKSETVYKKVFSTLQPPVSASLRSAVTACHRQAPPPILGGKKVHFFEISKIAHALRAISYIIKNAHLY